jgi:hypothetical protein
MQFLSKLTGHGRMANKVCLQTEVPRTPAEVPRVELELRRSFLRPQVPPSKLAQVRSLNSDSLHGQTAGVPASAPDIHVAIPRGVPNPPPLSDEQLTASPSAIRS